MNPDILQDHDIHESSFFPEIPTILRGAGTVFIGMILGSALRYLFQFLVARKLGPELFGLFFLGFGLFKILNTITELGLPNGIIRYVAIFQGEKDSRRIKGVIITALLTAVAAGTIVGAAVFSLSRIISVHLFDKPALTPVLKYFAITLPFSTMTTMIVFTLQGFKILKYKIHIREIFEPLGRIIIAVLLMAWGYTLEAPLSAHLVVGVASVFVAGRLLWKRIPLILIRHVKPIFEHRKLFRFSSPLLFATFMGQLLLWTDTLMLGYFKASSTVGIYGAAQRTALLCSLILFSFHSIFAPIIADLHNRKKYFDLNALFKIVSKWSFSLNFPLCIIFILFSSTVLNLFGPGFIRGGAALKVLILGWLVHSYLGITGQMITMTGHSKLQLLNNVVMILMNIILNIFLIPEYGMLGAALATSTCIIVTDIVTTLEVRFILNMHPFRKDCWKAPTAGGIGTVFILMFTGLVRINYNTILFTIMIGMLFILIYIALIFALGISKEEVFIFRMILERLKVKNGQNV